MEMSAVQARLGIESAENQTVRFAKSVLLMSPALAAQLAREVQGRRVPSYASWACHSNDVLAAVKKRCPIEAKQVFTIQPIVGSPFSQDVALLRALNTHPDCILVNIQVIWDQTLVNESAPLLYRLSSLLNPKVRRLSFDLFTPGNTIFTGVRLVDPLCGYCTKVLTYTANRCLHCRAIAFCSAHCSAMAHSKFHTSDLCRELRQVRTGFLENWVPQQIIS